MITCKPVLIVYLTSVAFFKAAECNLENVFRTPKDRTRINFDHLELVERAGFEPLETTTKPTTTTELPFTSSKEPGMAHAQVSIRFGGDDVQGSYNHIMKIPPQARHHGCPNEIFYPPPQHRYDHPHYYHPYPPPVPFNFPNYYFCNYGPGGHSLPPQLREYFGRHPEFFDGSYSRRKEQVFIWGRPLKKEDLVDLVVPAVNATNVEESHVSLSNRAEVVNATLKLSNEKIEEDVNQIGKTVHEKEKIATTNKVDHKIHVTHRHKKAGKRKTKHSSYDQDLNELEHLLEKALETFKCESTEKTSENNFVMDKHQSNTKIISDNSITDGNCGCDKESNSTKSDAKKFSNDLDDLVTVIIGVMDQPQTVTKNLPSIFPSNQPLIAPTETKTSPSDHNNKPNKEEQKKSEWFPTQWIMVPFRGDNLPSNPLIPPYLDNSERDRLGSDGFCHKCGRKHLGGNFCHHCGSPIHHHHPPSFCPLCKKFD